MSGKWLIGVDIGGTTTKIAFIQDYGEIIEKWEIPTDNKNQGKSITINISQSIKQKLVEHQMKIDQIRGIGVGAPGPANIETGIMENTPNLAWHDHYPLRELLENETGLPVIINNDANCAALGEMWKGAGEGAKDLVCVTLGTGVGGGVIANGKAVQGVHGAAGEIGHITSIPKGGAPCNCGKSGCLETIASATGIVRLTMEELTETDKPSELRTVLEQNGQVTSKDVFDAARSKDELAMHVVDKVAFHLGLALAN